MASFNDWLTVTDPALLAEHLAEQFRLSQNELAKVSQALAPAFALGLQRALADPAAAAALSEAFRAMVPGSGYGAAAVPNAGPGQAFVDAFFGSDALTGAVARQASMFAGIAPDTIQKLMPGLAMLTMEMMARAAMARAGNPVAAPPAASDLAEGAAEIIRRGASALEALARPSGVPAPGRNAPAAAGPGAMADALAAVLSAGLPGPARPKAASVPVSAGAAARDASPRDAFTPLAPLSALFEALAAGLPDAAGRNEPPAPRGERDGSPGDVLRSGDRLGDGYAREMAALFGRYAIPGRAV